MTESTVIYRAIADFAALRHEIKALRSDIRELEAEEAAFNKSQGRSSGASSKTHLDSAKAVLEESKSLNVAEKSLRSHTTALSENNKHTKEAALVTERYAAAQKTVATALTTISRINANINNSSAKVAKSNSDSVKNSEEYTKAIIEQGKATRELTDDFTNQLTTAQRLREEQRAAARSALDTASDIRTASRDAARASSDSADTQIDDIRRIENARSQAANNRRRDERGRFLPNSLPPIVGGNLRGGTGGSRDSGGGGLPNLPDIPSPPVLSPSSRSNNDDGGSSNVLNKIIKGAKSASDAVAGLITGMLKLALVGAAIGPLVTVLVALGAAALGAVGAFSEIANTLLVLPGLFAVAAVGVTALAVAFRGIGTVFQAYAAKQKAAATSAKSEARAQLDAAKAIKDAELELQRAKEDSSRVRADAAERITDAERNLNEATQDQARNAIDADERIIDADHNLIKAQRDLKKSQLDVNQARIDALQTLVDLRREVEHGAINEEAAVADLAKTQEAYNKILADPSSTATDKIKGLSDLHLAQQRIVDVQEKNKKSEEELAKASAKGVDGSDRVVNANEALIEAQKTLREATEEVTRSREDQTRSEKDNADKVVDAKKELVRAREDESRVAVDSDKRISDAEFALVKANEALVNAQTRNTAAARAYQAALDKLSPSAQKFVLGLIGMSDAFKEIRLSVQEALFAPLVGQLDNIRAVLPDIKDNLTKVAAAFGNVFAAFIQWVTSPEMKPFFAALSESTAQIINILGPALIKVFQGIANLIIVSLPFITRMAEAFDRLATKFANFLSTAEGQAKVTGLLEQGFKRAKEFWTILGNLASAFGSLLSAATPFNDWIVGGLTKGTERFKEWAAAQKLDGSPFKTYLENVKPLLVEIGHLLKQFSDYIFHQAADPKNIRTAIELLQQIRTELGPALGHLFDALRDSGLLQSFFTLITKIALALTDLLEKGGGGAFTKFLQGMGGMADVFKKLIDSTPAPVLSAIATTLGVLAVLKFTGVFSLLGALTSPRLLAALGALAGPAGLAAVAAGIVAIGAVIGIKKANEFHDTGVPGQKKNAFETRTQPGHTDEVSGAFVPDQVPVSGPVIPGQERGTVNAPEVVERMGIGKKVDETKDNIKKFWDFVVGFVFDIKKLFGPDFIKIWDTIKDKAKEAFQTLGPDLKKLFIAAEPLLKFLGGALILALKLLTSVFANTLGPVLDQIIGTIHSFLEILTGIIDFLTGVFTGDWSLAWKGIQEIFGGIWDAIVNKIVGIPEVIFGIIKGLVEGVVKFFEWLFDKLLGHSIIPDIINGIIDWFTGLPKKLFDAIKGLAEGIANVFGDVFKGVGKLLGKVFDPIKDAVTNAFKGIVNAAFWVWSKIAEVFSKPVEFVVNTIFGGLIGALNKVLGFIHLGHLDAPKISWNWSFRAPFAKGGHVPGEGDQDTVPAMLTPGEFVIKKSSVKKIGLDRLHAMNEGQEQHFISGGPVVNVVKKGIGAAFEGVQNAAGFVSDIARKGLAAGLRLTLNGILAGALHLIPGNVLGIPEALVKKIADLLVGFVEGKKQAFAEGGRVPGTGEGDSVPAMLTPGEFVMRKSAVGRIGLHTLKAMNDGVQHFAEGGLVDKNKVGSNINETFGKNKSSDLSLRSYISGLLRQNLLNDNSSMDFINNILSGDSDWADWGQKSTKNIFSEFTYQFLQYANRMLEKIDHSGIKDKKTYYSSAQSILDSILKSVGNAGSNVYSLFLGNKANERATKHAAGNVYLDSWNTTNAIRDRSWGLLSQEIDSNSNSWNAMFDVLNSNNPQYGSFANIVSDSIKQTSGTRDNEKSNLGEDIKNNANASVMGDRIRAAVGRSIEHSQVARAVSNETLNRAGTNLWELYKSIPRKSGNKNNMEYIDAVNSAFNVIYGARDSMMGVFNTVMQNFNRESPSGKIRNIYNQNIGRDEVGQAITDKVLNENISGVGNLGKRLRQKFALGGKVPGSGDRDSVPAMLTPGEFVMRKAVVDQLGAGLFEHLNAQGTGQMARHAAGALRAGQGLSRGGPVKGYGSGGQVWDWKPDMYQMFAAGGLVQPQAFQMPGQLGLSSNITSNNETTNNSGFTVENLHINNPVAESASDSLPNAIRKIAYLSS